MTTKTLIAAAAIAATAAIAAAPAAKADPSVSFSIGFSSPGYGSGLGFGPGFGHGFGGSYGGGYGHGPFWGGGYHHPRPHFGFDDRFDIRPQPVFGMGCGQAGNVVRDAGFSGVEAVNCRGPVYRYEAWKRGELFTIAVNTNGRIVQVSRAF